MAWENIKKALSRSLPANEFELWIKPLVCLESSRERLVLAAENAFFARWVSDRYARELRNRLTELGRSETELVIRAADEGGAASAQLALPHMPEARESVVRTLHPRFTFDEFMTGESNAMARTACDAIANGDTSLGQAVYLKAGHGLGKSHLTQAVAHHVLRNRRGEVIVYRTAHQFTADMVRSIRTGDMDSFNRTYHGCDILLLENLPALSGRTKSQEIIVQAIDTLTERGKRIIYTGNLAPLDIDGIDPELKSKLSSALIATINPPDRLTRIHIVRRKAKNCGLSLSEELVEMLARDLTGDIRRVESAIATIKARASLEKKKPDQNLVESVLRDILGRQRRMTAETIRDFIADQFRIPVQTLRSRTRKRAVALPRQIGMYLARKHTDEGLAAIGRAFNRDHSTVVHAVRAVTEQMNRSTSIREQVELIDRKLAGEG